MEMLEIFDNSEEPVQQKADLLPGGVTGNTCDFGSQVLGSVRFLAGQFFE